MLPDPGVILHADAGAGSPLTRTVRGAPEVAGQALRFARLADSARPVLVSGMPGLLAAPPGRPFVLLTVAVRGDLIVQIDVIADADRLRRLGQSAGSWGHVRDRRKTVAPERGRDVGSRYTRKEVVLS